MEVTNLDEFNFNIDKFTASIPDKVVAIHKKITFEAFVRLVMKTPVDTGRAKGNWMPTIDAPFEGVLEVFDKTPLGSFSSEANARIKTLLTALKPYQTTWICNNVVYIVALEEGHSQKQAPFGMMALTVEELRQIFP